MSLRPGRGSFVAGFVAGAIVAAAATGAAQSGLVNVRGIYGLQPSGNAVVACFDASLSRMRSGISPVTYYAPIQTPDGVTQRTAMISCPS